MDNTVTVLFAAGQTRAVAAKPLYQWAYGQKLVFSGLDLPASYQVDFSNFEYAGTSVPQVGGAEGVTVPVGVLDTGRDVYAFVWVQDENAGRIEYCAEIPVIPCPEPDLEDPNPEEESTIAQAITALNGAVEQTGEDAASAAASAEAAEETVVSIAGRKSYEPLLGGTFAVTTAEDAAYVGAYARAAVTGRIPKTFTYKVTFDGTEYALPCRLYGFIDGGISKVVEYLGNLALYKSGATDGVTHEVDDVPFFIVSDVDGHSAIDVCTSEAGAHTILVEKCIVEGVQTNNYPIYGDAFSPIEKVETTGTYCGVSIGEANKLENKRGTVAIGSNNTLSAEFSKALGDGNTVNGEGGVAIGTQNTVGGTCAVAAGALNETGANYAVATGYKNKATGSSSHAEGRETVASGGQSHAEGYLTAASGSFAHAEGRETVASGGRSHAEGQGTVANHKSQHVFGEYNEADGSAAAATARGDYAEIVGNGTADNARSNARTLDWEGNEALAGSLTLGKGTEDEATASAAQLGRAVRAPDNLDRLHGLFAAVSVGSTKRVSEGTQILNQLTADNLVAQLGYYYNSDDDKLSLFCVFAKTENVDSIASAKYYTLVYSAADSVAEDFELTLETAPHVTQRGAGNDTIYKMRLNNSSFSTKSPFVMRLCSVLLDSDGNEIGRTYSAQYKYVLADGVVTRTRIPTSPQSAEVIEDLGLYKNAISVPTTFAFVDGTDKELLPIVSTDETAEFRFVIPDIWYDSAQYGYAIAARDGAHRFYRGPTIYKAEDDVLVVTLTPTALDYSGEMNHTVAEILEAYLAKKRIFFDVSDGAGNSSRVAVTQVGSSASGAYPSFNAYIIMDGLNVIIYAYTGITDDGTKNTYSTIIYALTPYTP